MKKLGRPVGTYRPNKTKTLCVRVTPKEYEKLKTYLEAIRQLKDSSKD